MRRFMPLLAASLLILNTADTAVGFDYEPTRLAKAMAAHELVLVGTVKERVKGQVKVEPVAVIKGTPPARLLTLPDVWRPGTQFTFGPISLVEGKTYFLMLHLNARGELTLSKDFAADGVVAVSSPHASLVRAADIVYSLSIQKKEESRKQTLDRAWDKETVETKRRLLEEFLMNPADSATVPILVRSMNAGNDQSSVIEMAGLTLRKHRYQEAVPDLLKVLRKMEGSSLYAAQTLAAMKVKEAYEPIMALIEDPKLGNRPYFIETLAQLEDKRALPFLLQTLHRNLPGIDPNHGKYNGWDLQENEFAAMGLGRLKAAEAVEPLRRILEKARNYRKLQTLAVEALGEIGSPARPALSAIRELMRTETIDREVGEEAIRKIEKE